MPPNAPNDRENISGVYHEEIAAVAALFATLPNIQAQPVDRFAQAVRSLVEKRACAKWPNEGTEDVAVFVMVDHPRPIGERHGAQPFADPIATEVPLLGRLFFANRDASTGRVMDIPTEPGAILEWIDENDLSSSPVILVYRQNALMITRPSGTTGLSNHTPIRDSPPVADLPELHKALRHFHMQHVLTPSSCPKGLWETGHAHHYIPGPRPEATIQSHLTIVLNSWFHGILRAEREDSTNIGRIDVRLLQPGPTGSLNYWAIMELKVIRSFTNANSVAATTPVAPQANEDAIANGIRQAHAYRANRSADESLVEVFDLRQDKRVDLRGSARIQSTLAECPRISSIEVRPVFGSANDARIAGYTGV